MHDWLLGRGELQMITSNPHVTFATRRSGNGDNETP
jgi:hypothetical protein